MEWNIQKNTDNDHRQEMNLELLKGRWNKWGSFLYIRTNCARLLYQVDGDDAIDRSVKELSQPNFVDGITCLAVTWESKLFYN